MTLPIPQAIFDRSTPGAPSFYLGFDGVTEFLWKGKRYAARHHLASRTMNKAECLESMDALLGCAYGESCDNRHDWPPAELMEWFPGWRMARYKGIGTFRDVECTFGILTIENCEWEFSEQCAMETVV